MSKFDDCQWNNCLYLVTTTGDGAGSQLVWGLAAVYDLYLKLIVGGGETDAYEGEAEYVASALIDGAEWHGDGSDGLPLTKTWDFEDGTFGVIRVTDERIPAEVMPPPLHIVTDRKAATDMPCDCVENMQKLLEPENTKLALTIQWSSGHAFPTIQTEKIAPRGKRSAVVVPSYCPFCGTSYQDGSTETVE